MRNKKMRLLTTLCTILLTIAFCQRAAHAQDSPIYLNDNGNIPIEIEGKRGKAPSKAKKRPRGVRTVHPSIWETHIHHDGGIRYDPKTKEFFIEVANYRAVCL